MWGDLPEILDGAGFQLATIVVCLSAILYTMIHSKPEKLQNKLFLFTVINILITAVCNFLSALAKPYMSTSEFMLNLRQGSQYVYFLFHSFLAPLFCFYISLITGANYVLGKKKRHFIFEFPMIISFLLVLINPATHWVYYFSEDGEFHRNWAENIIYGIGIMYFLFAVIMLFFYWKVIDRKTKRIMIYFFTLVGLGTLAQFLLMPLHTELFSEAIAMTAIMITIEDEEGRKDSRTKIYNYAALSYDVQKLLSVKRSFYLICIKMQNPMSLMRLVGPANIEMLTEQTVNYLATIVPRYTIYYIGTGTFVILNQDSGYDKSLEIAKTIKGRFNHSWRFQDRDTTFNAAVFCAEIPTDLKTVKDIMMLINGPAPVEHSQMNDVFFGSGLNYVIRRSQVEGAIINGLNKKSFEVYYQPIYNVSDLSICAGEALLRLHDSEIGDIYPDEFLPIAERSGMIFELGDFVLDEVCKFLNSGIPTEMGIETLNVNLSVVQCIQSNYAERIIELVSKYDISPSKIAFEITESAATTDFDALREFVTKLRARGFRFTVDDYGVGYSNVHSILSLDVDIIKIDRSILWEAEQSEIGRIIMDSSVNMIKRMGKQILITGVETKSQIGLAGEFGVDYLQGYYFSNPISQNEFIGILKATQIAKFEEQKALAASAAMSDFIANMSHEIRTPINAVLGMDEMILRESKDEKIIEYAKTIEGAGRTLLSLINDILDFSKIEKGNIEITESNYELSSLLTDVVNMVLLKAESKGLILVTDVESSTPEKLYGDEMRIRQIIINLLNNAVKYTEEGSVTLTAGYEWIDKHNIKLIISIKATGIGIHEQDMGKLFDKFKRLDVNKNKTVEGSGLGLAITNQLLKLMGGNISVESKYGEGSTFTVEIPQKVLTEETIGSFSRKHNTSENDKAVREWNYTAPDARILIVDDTAVNRMVVKELLKRTEVIVDEASGGKECIEMASKTKYDLILLDYRMPEMDGIEVIQHLKVLEDNASKDAPIVALTANAMTGSREKFLNEGFDDYVSKPVAGERLEKLLLTTLPKNKIIYGKESYVDEKGKLNVESGIEKCGSKEAYEKVLRVFKDEIEERVNTIKEAYENKDIKRYTIEVHAIKSSSRVIGADALSKLAEKLEEAGNNNDIKFIDDKNSELLVLYESYKDIKEETGFENEIEEGEKKELSEEDWIDALKTLRELAYSMDFNNASQLVMTIKNYKLLREKKETINKLDTYINKLDWDELVGDIDKILKQNDI